MATLEKALQFAAAAHDGQKDQQGFPYILHPLRVMQSVQTIDEMIVAVLHDVVEDTLVTINDLREAGFTRVILEAVQCVTYSDSESYADYVVGCKANPLARAVKIADLTDNTQLSRVLLREDRCPRDLSRIRKYILSYRFLTDQISEAAYRERMQNEP